MRSFYTIISRWSDEIRPFTVEGEVPETADEVRFQIGQFAHGQSLYRVYRCDADECLMVDCTDDFQTEQLEAAE